MPLYFQRPENAPKIANECIDVGEKQCALDVIKSAKHGTLQKIHEPIMTKYWEHWTMYVDFIKNHVGKEVLDQFINICLQVNRKSPEKDVLSGFGYLELVEEKTDAAKEESQQSVDLDEKINMKLFKTSSLPDLRLDLV